MGDDGPVPHVYIALYIDNPGCYPRGYLPIYLQLCRPRVGPFECPTYFSTYFSTYFPTYFPTY